MEDEIKRKCPLLFGFVLRRSVATSITILLLATGTASARWLNIQLPGTPRTADAAVIEGPVVRGGGRNLGNDTGTSVYVRDPDQNLLEFMIYS